MTDISVGQRWRDSLSQRPALAATILLAVCLGVFSHSLRNEFVLDDIAAVVENPCAGSPVDMGCIFTTNYWGNRSGFEELTIYRPLATLSFAVTDTIFGQGCPPCHRVWNLLMLFLCCWLLYRVALAAGLSAVVALTAALFFAVHPIHVEAVVAVVNRAELLSAAFVLAGVLVFLRSGTITSRRRWGDRIILAGLYAGAVLSKENGLMLWGILVGIEFVRILGSVQRAGIQTGVRVDWQTHLCLLSVASAYFLLRGLVLPAVLGGTIPPPDNPMVMGGLLARVLTPFKIYWQYLSLLVVPYPLTIDYSLNHFPAVSSLLEWRPWVGLGLFLATCGGGLALAFGFAHRPGPEALPSLVAVWFMAFLAAYLPGSSLLFPSTIIVAERLMFLPSAFFILALATTAEFALQGQPAGGAGRRAIATLACLVLVLFGGWSGIRVTHWRWAGTLYSQTLRVSPNSARAQALHGTELLHEGDLAGAALHLLRSLSIWPHNPVVQTTCGRALFEQGRLADALIHADAALALRRNQPSALILRSMILGSLGRPGEAIPDARKYVRLVPTDSHGCLVLASLIRDAGQFQEALGQLVSCMKNDPALRPPLELVCSIYRNTGKPPQAKDACERMPGR